MLSRWRSTEATHSTSTARLVVLKPPAVDPGEPPTSIVSVHSISAGPERAVWSMVLKPAVRVVTD